jgi:hypothetical protein
MMRAVWVVLVAGFRRQWRSWVLLGLLIAVASGPRMAMRVVQAWLIVALAAGALLAANALAAVPAMSAARSRPGPLLRTE